MQYFIETSGFSICIQSCRFENCGLVHIRICGFAVVERAYEFADLRTLKKIFLAHLREFHECCDCFPEKNIGRRGLKTTTESVKSSPKVGKAAVMRSVEEAVPRSKVRPGTGGSSQGSASPPYAVVEKVQVLFTDNLKGDIF